MNRLSRPHTRLAVVGWTLLTLLAFSFVVWPAFDIAVSDAVHDPARDPAFFLGEQAWVLALFEGTPLCGRTLVVVVLLVTLIGLWARFAKTFGRWWRRSVLLLIVAAIGHGIVVSWLLKEMWERPRQRDHRLRADGRGPALGASGAPALDADRARHRLHHRRRPRAAGRALRQRHRLRRAVHRPGLLSHARDLAAPAARAHAPPATARVGGDVAPRFALARARAPSVRGLIACLLVT